MGGNSLKISKLVGKDVAQLDLELVHHGFELVEGDVVFALLDAEEGHVGNPGLFGELGIGHFTPGFAEVFGNLSIQALSHPGKVARNPSRMCDVLC